MTAPSGALYIQHRRFRRTFAIKESEMDLFVGTWKVIDWRPDTEDIVPEGIPGDGFMVSGPLNIMRELTLTSDFYRVEWLTLNSHPCSASGLQLTGENPPTISSANVLGIVVNFGERELFCNLTLALDPTDPSKVNGTISLAGVIGTDTPDTGSGTFTATASPGI
jgi:hypothetical protein